MRDNYDLKVSIAVTAINTMMRSSFFSICAIDRAATTLGVNPRKESYNMLRALHCINFSAMPLNVRDSIPALIADCLGDPPAFQFNQPQTIPAVQYATVIDVQEIKPGLFKRLQLAFKG